MYKAYSRRTNDEGGQSTIRGENDQDDDTTHTSNAPLICYTYYQKFIFIKSYLALLAWTM